MMWRNYLLVGLRALARSRVYSTINLLGLAIGIASCILTLLFVRYELSYDSWLPDAERVHAVQAVTKGADGSMVRSARAPRAAAEALRQNFPQIEQVVALTRARPVMLREGQSNFAEIHFVDSNFLDVLQLPLVRGDPRTALSQAGNLLITESEARRLFGTDDPMGQEIVYLHRGEQRTLRVTGVLRDIPENSHLQFSLVTPFAYHMYGSSEREFASWSNLSSFVYVKLREGADSAAINGAMRQFIARNIPDRDGSDPVDLAVVPVRDVYLNHTYDESMRPGGDPLAVTAFSLIALLILIIACINYTNLATAQSSQRAREVALRKVLGARPRQLMAQFLAEAILLTLAATLLGLAIVELVVPSFSALVGADLAIDYFGAGGLLPFILLLAVAVGLVCGIYPAFVLSRFAPGGILRAHVDSGAPGSVRMRNALVLSQFAVSIALIICTVTIYLQTEHVRRTDPGYDRDGLLVVDNISRGDVAERLEAFTAQLRGIPGVSAVARSDLGPAEDRESKGLFRVRGAVRPTLLFHNSVDWSFLQATRIPLIAGRFLSERQALDNATADYNPYGPDAEALLQRGANVVVNASAARRLGFADPAAAVGAQITTPFIARDDAQMPATIVGVVGDAQFRSARDGVRPAVYRFNERMFAQLLIRHSGESPNEIRTAVERLWQAQFPDLPFEADFARDRVYSLYTADDVRGIVFAGFTGLALIVASLGLFGLAAFSTRRRTREIGIRKVFGARTGDIAGLLVWQFCQPVLLANLIAWPAAWWLMRDWLNQFSARIDLHPGWFLGAGTLALAIAALTVAAQALRVARINPIHALRYE